MAEGHAAKRQRVGDADTEDVPKLSAGTAKLVEELESALANYLHVARKLSQSDPSVGGMQLERALVGLRDAFSLFKRMFPGFGVNLNRNPTAIANPNPNPGWELADAAKIVLHTLETDPTGDTTARVAKGERGAFAAYFSPHQWVRLVNE